MREKRRNSKISKQRRNRGSKIRGKEETKDKRKRRSKSAEQIA